MRFLFSLMTDNKLEANILAQLESSTELKSPSTWIESLSKVLSLSESKVKNALDSFADQSLITVVNDLVYLLNNKPYAIGSFRLVRETFAFVETIEDSIYVAQKDFNHALDMDDVLIEIKSDEKKFGEVIASVKHNREFILGTMTKKDGGLHFVPYDTKIKHETQYVMNGVKAKESDRVIARIVDYSEILELELISILGQADEPGMDVLSILYVYGIDLDFDEDVKEAVKSVPSSVSSDQFEDRVDHRDQYIITIDGEDAKDLDDAIYMESKSNGYRLYVHIADVAHYVPKGSVIDKSAFKRASSVYTVDRVVPMLPKELSNGVCSLHPNVDRLAMTAMIDLDHNGAIIDSHIYESIIQSKQRLSYKQVNSNSDMGEAKEMVDLMLEAARLLNAKRDRKGSIGFDSDESQFIIDHEGNILDVFKRESGEAETMIEAFMVCANEVVAQKVKRESIPALFRVHEAPAKEKMQDLSHTLRILGYQLKGSLEDVKPKLLQQALEFFKDKPAYPVVSKLVLRSMSKARYSEEPLGHFGLALDDYAHFTSPIRRYPDLMLHQRLKQYSKPVKPGVREKDEEFALEAADHTSKKERSILDAERQVEKVKKAQFMEAKIGETYIGYVSGVMNFGMFVELPNTIEGLVHVRTLRDDFYQFDMKTQKLIGEHSNKSYAIGQKVNVKLVSVDMVEYVINFELIRDRKRTSRKPNPNKNSKTETPKKGEQQRRGRRVNERRRKKSKSIS